MGSRARIALLLGVLVLLASFLWLPTGTTPQATTDRATEGSITATPGTAAAEVTIPSVAPSEVRSVISQDRAEPTLARVELHVTSSDARPVAQALVVLYRGEAVIASGVTDGEGLVAFPSETGRADAVVSASGWPLQRASLELDPGRHSIVLADGAVLGGWVLVDGAVPPEPIEIRFEEKSIPKDAGSLPQSVLALLVPELKRNNPTAIAPQASLHTTTDVDGAFLLRGLTRDGLGLLTWSGPYVLEDAERKRQEWDRDSLETWEVRRDLELRLTLGIELRFRVVDPNGAPVPGAGVDGTVVWSSDRGVDTFMLRGSADSAGKFRGTIGRAPPTQVHVRLTRSDGLDTTHELACPPGMRGVWDVGDLALHALRKVRLHVQDGDGAPVERARAIRLPSRMILQAIGDEQGNLEVPIGDDRQLLVQALGHESAIVDVPVEATEIVATLTRACLLEFSLVNGERIDRRPLAVTVSGSPPILADDAPGSIPLLQVFGASARDRQDQGTASYRTDSVEDGRWKVSGLVPGVALRAVLTARGGRTLAAVDIAPLARGEHRVVELPLDRPPRSLRVHVIDANGRPVRGARVESLQDRVRAIEEPDGNYQLESIYTDEFTLLMEAEGLAPKRLYFVVIPPQEIEAVLEPGRSLELELVGPDGTALRGGFTHVKAGPDEHTLRYGVLQSSGRWLVTDLPDGEVLIDVRSDAGPVMVSHDMSEPFRRLVVGERGEVHVTAEIPGEPSDPPCSIAIYGDGGSRVEARARPPARFVGLPFGVHTVRLEVRSQQPPWDWIPVGDAQRVVLEAEHPSAEIQLRP